MYFINFFLLFLLYSTLGWLIETLYIYTRTKKLVDRGFLIGPYCPIYGWGCMAITILLKNYTNSPIILFCMSVIICSILEYFTSYVLEKIYKTRWWDYSKRKFNINGRICLETMIPFGILGTIIMYFINPIFIKFLNNLSEVSKIIIFLITFSIFLIDNIISFEIVGKFSEELKTNLKDETEEIKKYTKKLFENKSIFNKRLIDAFPHVKKNLNKLREKRKDKKDE